MRAANKEMPKNILSMQLLTHNVSMKFNEEMPNELEGQRLLAETFFHSSSEPSYSIHLRAELPRCI